LTILCSFLLLLLLLLSLLFSSSFSFLLFPSSQFVCRYNNAGRPSNISLTKRSMQNKEASKAVKTFFMHRKDLNKKRPQSAAALRRSTSKSSSSSPSLSSLHLQRPSSAVVLNGSSEFSSQYALKTTEKHIRENVKKNDWGDAKTRNLVSKSLF